jgi:hypothetical protein
MRFLIWGRGPKIYTLLKAQYMTYPLDVMEPPEMVGGGVVTFVFQPNEAFDTLAGMVKYVPAGTLVIPTVVASMLVLANPAEYTPT